MDKKTAEVIIKIWSVLFWLSAFLFFILGIGSLFAGSIVGKLVEEDIPSGAFTALGMVAGLLFLALAVFYVFVGIHLWQRKPWTRIATIVLSAISILSFPIGTIIGGLGIWFFGFDESMKSLFNGKKARSPVIKKKAVKAKKTKKKARKKVKK